MAMTIKKTTSKIPIQFCQWEENRVKLLDQRNPNIGLGKC